MIVEFRNLPRGSGKTTWAKNKAEEINGTYMCGAHEFLGSIAKYRGTQKPLIVDEPFYLNPEDLTNLLHLSRYIDIYLIGTLLSCSHPIVNILRKQFPEQFI